MISRKNTNNLPKPSAPKPAMKGMSTGKMPMKGAMPMKGGKGGKGKGC